MRDNLPSYINNGHFIIINMDSTLGQGTHWISIYNDNGIHFYFDSFGQSPPNEIIKKYGKIVYSTIQLQHKNTTSCGAWCIYFANQMLKNQNFYDTLYKNHSFNPNSNEQILKKYFKNL